MSNYVINQKIKYKRLLSSLFCTTSIMLLSILCLLNNLTLDLYSTCALLKVVIPASFCFWYIGYVIGHMLDANRQGEKKTKSVKLTDDNEAYSIPSMFLGDDTQEPVEENEEI